MTMQHDGNVLVLVLVLDDLILLSVPPNHLTT